MFRHRKKCAVCLSTMVLTFLTTTASAQVDIDRLSAMQARSIGPSGMSGRISAIDAVAKNPNVIYVGAATGGLWKSVNGGATWKPIMDSLPATSIGAVAIFQEAPDIVWAGTGERNRRNSAGVGTGVYKSMDGGRTWTHVGLANTESIDAIILHPTDPNIAYVGALGPTWGDGIERGVFETTDGGKSWTNILYVNEATGAGDLVMDPANPNHLIAGMWEFRRWPWFFKSGGPGSGLYMTWDGGETWEQLTSDDGLPEGELGRIGLAFSRSSPNVVYALVEATRSELLRSDDGGRSWEMVNDDRGIAVRPFYYGQLRVDPENENRVYDVASVIRVSEDGGKTFEVMLPFARVHVDHHAFWINPLDGQQLITGNDGGVYMSQDRGGGWRFIENLPLAQFYHISVDMDTPFNVYGGLQDNGSWKGPSHLWENGGIRYYHWDEVAFGDGFATLSDPSDRRYGYGMSQGGNLVRFDQLTGERKSVRPAHPDGLELRFNWNAGIAIDPFDNAVYYGSQFVHKTTDHGHSWTIISSDLTTNDPEKQNYHRSGGLTYDASTAENHTTILTIAPSEVERDVMWVGTDDGNVQITRDGGENWENVIDRIQGAPEAAWIPHIEPSKFDDGEAFVVFDNHRRSDRTPYIYKTTDYGRSWESLVTDEIEGFIHVVEQDPVNPNLLFLGTEFGMYVSLNGGQNWLLWMHGVPRAPVRALVVHPRDHDLVIGTHGRAAYILDDVRPLRALATNPALAAQAVHLFQIPPTIQYQVAQVGGMRFLADAKFVGENRPYGALLTYYVNTTEDSVEVEFAAMRGSDSIRTFTRWAKPGINRTTWDLRQDAIEPPSPGGGGGGGGPFNFTPLGPRVLAGTYTVTVKLEDNESSQDVDVSFDPRFDLSLADRQAKIDAQLRASQRRAVASEAMKRLRDTKESIDDLLGRLNGDDSTHTALKTMGDSVKKQIDELLEEFGGPQDIQGFMRTPRAVMRMIGGAAGSLSSSWDRPTESQMTYLRQAEERLEGVLAETNSFFETQFSEFRAEAITLDLEVLEGQEALSIDWRPEKGR